MGSPVLIAGPTLSQLYKLSVDILVLTFIVFAGAEFKPCVALFVFQIFCSCGGYQELTPLILWVPVSFRVRNVSFGEG